MHNNLNGWLNLYKPTGISSAKAVAIIKRKFNIKKIGHTGTLDPLAEGVLPLAINEATKLVRFLINEDKEYEFIVKWGEATDSYDSEGKVTDISDIEPKIEDIQHILEEFRGEILQAPPRFSAIKIDGRRAYDLARNKNIEFEIKPRKVNIKNIEIINHDVNLNETEFRALCSKGTYVRSIAHDIGKKLGCYGHVTRLIRTRVGKFVCGDAILLENAEKLVYKDDLINLMHDITALPDDIPGFECDDTEKNQLSCGKIISKESNLPDETIVILSNSGKIFAIGQIFSGKIKPLRVLNLN